jgi:transglutaminase-like putative cysteine protease
MIKLVGGIFFTLVVVFSFSHPNNEEIVYLVDFAYVKVFHDYSKETLIHQKIKINGEKGKKLSHLQIPFDSEREKVKFVEGYTLLPNGKKITITEKDIKIVTPAEFTEYTSLYPGYKVISINFPGVEIGSIIEYKYIINTFKPLIENNFWDGFYFQSTEPFLVSRYELSVPKRMKLNIFEKDIKLTDKKEKFGYITYIWEKKEIPPIIEEILMPPLTEFVPKVYVSTFNSWSEIGKWFYEITEDKKKKSEELKSIVEKLIENKKSEEEKIIALYNYVCSNIRYVGLEMGIHGYKPHSPEEVLKAKYGDCKDKANLLKKMLEFAGIKSYLSLINTESNIEKDIPFPGQFNHAIIAIATGNSYIFLDPTSEVMKYPHIPPSEQGKYTLICKEEPQLLKTPVFSPKENTRRREIEATIDENGNLKGKVKIVPSGIFEGVLRNSFRYLRPIERERALLKELNSILPGTKLISFEITGLESLDNQLIEKYEFFTSKYGIKVANKIIFQPSLIDKLTDLSIVSLEERKYPLRLGYNFKKEEIIEYKLPENFEIETLPNSFKIEEPFGIFSLNIEKTNSGFKIYRLFQINEFEISPEIYPKFKEFYKNVSSYDKLPVILNLKGN